MTSGTAINVRALATQMLDAVRTHWANAPGAPLPDRQYVAPGEPRATAWDCEQLTVSLGGVGWGPAIDAGPTSPRSGTPASVASVRHAVLYVQLVRCMPTSGKQNVSPTVAALQAAGEQFMRDAGLLSQALVSWASTVRTLLPQMPTESVQVGVIEPVGPSGGFVGLEASAIVTAAQLEAA